MFGLSYGEFVQGSALRTWNCVAHFASLLWYKFNHLKDPIMPRSRRRHHSRSRSRSRSHSHERDREPKRRKIESYDSPQHRRSVSSEPEANADRGIDETDIRTDNLLATKNSEQLDVIAAKDKNEPGKIDVEKEEDKYEKSEFKADNDEEKEYEDEKESVSDPKDSTVELNDSDEEAMESNAETKEESIKNNTPSKLKDKTSDLKITPNKVLSPKQLQRKLESEKKRQERQKEKEEKERKKQEEKDEKERKRLEEKKRVTEEKIRLKQEKEEQKTKEKLAKEEKRKKEQEEKDKKRREREEKDEQKKKEREQEKLKKQMEIEEKIKEKQKLEEQKQKTAAAFANFFLLKKTESEERKHDDSSTFMPFEIKSDMRLAPLLRRAIMVNDKEQLDEYFANQTGDKLYLDELKSRKEIGKFGKTWPFEDMDQDDIDDVIIVDENVGETIVEQKSKFEKMRAKFFKFHENQRPPYFGTFRKKSKNVGPRKPFGNDTIFNYEIDSDEEWEEEGEGESLKGTDDEDEKENEPDNDYEVDNDVFVPHGHLSDDEVDDEINAKLSPESHKMKLKLLKNEFDEEMKSKTHKIKPRVIGCIWYNKTKSNVDEAIDRYLQPFAMICVGQIDIKKRSQFALATKKVAKQLSKEHVPLFLKLIHGSMDKRKNIVASFIEHMSNNGVQLAVTKISLGRLFKNVAQWKKCPEEGAMHNKMCWYVGEDVRREYNVDLSLPNKLISKRAKPN